MASSSEDNNYPEIECRENCTWSQDDAPSVADPYCDSKTGKMVYPEKDYDYPPSHLNAARTNKFLLTIQTPKCLRGEFPEETFMIGIQKANIPAVAIPSKNMPYRGGNIKVSSLARSPFDPLTVTFKVDSRWKRYKFMYDWLEAFSGQNTGTTASNGSFAHYTTMELIVFDELEQPTVSWKYELIFPVALKGVSLEYTQDPSEVYLEATFDYTFAYFKVVDSL